MPSKDPRIRVRRAAAARRRADLEYHTALELGREAGVGFAELARLAGVSRQAIRQAFLARR
jgi:DNA-binding XRE family transcriptional regulator